MRQPASMDGPRRIAAAAGRCPSAAPDPFSPPFRPSTSFVAWEIGMISRGILICHALEVHLQRAPASLAPFHDGICNHVRMVLVVKKRIVIRVRYNQELALGRNREPISL